MKAPLLIFWRNEWQQTYDLDETEHFNSVLLSGNVSLCHHCCKYYGRKRNMLTSYKT